MSFGKKTIGRKEREGERERREFIGETNDISTKFKKSRNFDDFGLFLAVFFRDYVFCAVYAPVLAITFKDHVFCVFLRARGTYDAAL